MLKGLILVLSLGLTPLIAQVSQSKALINQKGTVANLPNGCITGQLYFATDAAVGKNVYGCTTSGNPGVWTLQGDGPGTVTSVTIAGTTNQINVTGTCTITTTGTCTLALPSGLVLPGTINGLTITTTTGTFTLAAAKVLTVDKSLEFDGTDGVKITFPSTNAVAARTDAGQTFTGVQAFSSSPTMPTVSQADNSTKGATTAYVDTGLAALGMTRVASIYSAQTATIGSTLLYTAGTSKDYFLSGSVFCTAVTATATVTLTISYTDISGTAQTFSTTASACSALGASSKNALGLASLNIQTQTGSAVNYSVTVANGPAPYNLAIQAYQLN